MNPKEKEAEKELNSQETENIAEEQLIRKLPLPKRKSWKRNWKKRMKQLKTRRINIFACRQNLTITGNVQ